MTRPTRYRTNAQPNPTSGGTAAPYRHGIAPGAAAVQHCPTCRCGTHGGLENTLFGIPLGAQPATYQITIYALPPEWLTGYEGGDRYPKRDNDNRGAKSPYGTRAA